MSKNIGAYTGPGTMPAYVSINVESEGSVSITVRGAMHLYENGSQGYGDQATIYLDEGVAKALIGEAATKLGVGCQCPST